MTPSIGPGLLVRHRLLIASSDFKSLRAVLLVSEHTGKGCSLCDGSTFCSALSLLEGPGESGPEAEVSGPL